MKRLAQILTIKEFEKIEREIHLTSNQFNDLESFIEENSDSESEERLSDFLRISSSRGKKVIVPRNYVGVINIKNQVQIEILPKIDLEKDEDNQELRKLFLKMLASLKEFKSKSFKNAHLNKSNLPIYEVFISMYLNEVRDLLKKGLKSDYVTFEDNLPYFKGKFLVNQHIKHNLVRKERFFMQYDEFHLNRPENKLIKATLLKLLNLSSSAESIRLARQLLADFELIDPSINHDKEFASVRLDRNSKDYANLMTWSKVFLKNQSFSTFQGTNDVTALLFPMEKIFESYITQEVRKHFPEWNVSAQKQSRYLFDEPKPSFLLKPDIYLEKDDTKIIMDAKWKRLDSKKRNAGVDQSDLYQMYAYAYKYDVKDIFLIYPYHNGIDSGEIKTYRQAKGEDEDIHLKEINVTIIAVDLTNERFLSVFDELEPFKEKRKKKEEVS